MTTPAPKTDFKAWIVEVQKSAQEKVVQAMKKRIEEHTKEKGTKTN